MGITHGLMVDEDLLTGLGPAGAEVAAVAVTPPLIRGGDSPNHVNPINDGPVVLKLCRTRSPDHQDGLDRRVP